MPLDTKQLRQLIAIILSLFLMGHQASVLAEGRGESILPLPLEIKLDKGLVALGEKLFSDQRLSQGNNQSCASCHDLKFGGINRLDRETGDNQGFNTPTLFNVGFHFKLFWNGRASDLEEQIELTVTSPTVFNNTWPKILESLKADKDYQRLLARIQPGRTMDPDLLKKALAEFERSLWTPNSRFDKFLRGDASAITDEEKRGFQTFKNLGCSSCHQGMLLGGNMFQKFGIFSPKAIIQLEFPARDLGRYTVTQRDDDRYVFKVPSLRNIELTAPYLHNGAAKTLESAVTTMGRAQLGRHLNPDEVDSIVKFLKTLTGEWRGQALK